VGGIGVDVQEMIGGVAIESAIDRFKECVE
jgi:hypothetical protein